MRLPRYLGSLVLLCLALSVLVNARADASYQVVIFDGHLHSEYSDENPFTSNRNLEDIGADLHATFQGKPVIGALTDHSDVVRAYVWRSVLTSNEWIARQNDIARLSAQYIFLSGEEVTVGRTGVGLEEHGHLLVYGLNEMVPIPFEEPLDLEPGLTEPGDWLLPSGVWEGNPPRKDVKNILRTLPYGAMGYIAHPNGGYFRVNRWTDYAWTASRPYIGGKNGLIKGMEILSAGQDHGVENLGLRQSSAWEEFESRLAAGRNMFLIGGSDSHGARVLYPQIGSSFTYLLLGGNDDPRNKNHILNALRLGHTVASSGPFAVMEVTTPNDPEQYLPGDTVIVGKGNTVDVAVRWDPGILNPNTSSQARVTVFQCKNENESRGKIEKLYEWDNEPGSGSRSVPVQVITNSFVFAKVELLDRVAYTSPIYLDPPGTERGKIDVALVIDCSGSMTWNDPDGKRKEAAKQFIDMAQEGDRIAVVGFTSNAYIFAGLREIQTSEDRVALKGAVDRVYSSGGTDIGEGLITGLDELNQDLATDVRKGIILLTDGVSAYSNEHLLCRDAGVAVFTISLGYDTNPALLQRIADETGGKYYSAPSADVLQSIYNELSQALAGGDLDDRLEVSFSSPGQVESRTLTVSPGTLQLQFSIIWPGSDYDLTLVRPDGRELKPDSKEPDFSYVKGRTFASYTVDDPEPGNWTCIITANQVPSGGETVELSLSSIKMTPPQVFLEGFADNSILRSPVTVNARAEDPDGFSRFIFFLDGYEEQSYPVSLAQKQVSGSLVIDPGQLDDGLHWVTAWAADGNFTAGGEELRFIIDNTPPTADAGPDRVAQAGEEVVFDAGNSVDLAYCIWDFGDGSVEPGAYHYGFHTYSIPGVYTVRLTVYDDIGNQATDEATVTVMGGSSARSLKAGGAVKLLSSLTPSNHKSRTDLKQAIEYLQDSLTESLWVDDTHLDTKHGHKVFNAEKSAVQKLRKIVEEIGVHGDESLIPSASAAIDDIMKADELLARVAISEAKAVSVDEPKQQSKIDHQIQMAEEEMLKARTKLFCGSYANAIDHFRNAWEHAQDALRFAGK
ncbi:MAG: VWA domain-containing protein [Bacillota bacterium]|nr:VWA domain-containing protein [Bacillota bacterium]